MMWLWTWCALAHAVEAPPSINEAFSDERVYVGPFEQRLQALASRFGGTVNADLAALPDTGAALLYGDASSNPLLGEVLAHHRIELTEHSVRIGAHELPILDPFLIVALPGASDGTTVVAYTAFDVKVQPTLNQVFHGPTRLVVGSSRHGKLKTLFAGDYQLDEEGRVSGLEASARELSGEQVAEDVAAMHAGLVRGYGGLADVRATLQAQGTSWDVRVAAFQAEARAVPTWSFTEALDLIDRLLEPIDDTHFRFWGTSFDADGLPVGFSGTTVAPWRVWFAEGRLVRDGEGWRWGQGTLEDAPPAVPEPSEAVLGTTYRFPTVLANGDDAFLVGLFTTDEAPGPITLGGSEWPLHRPPRLGKRGPAWTLTRGKTPVLEVRTMVTSRLQGLADTGAKLRRSRSLVLDLRRNGGGSDEVAMDWVRALSPMPFQWHGATDVMPGDGPQAARTTQHEPSLLESEGPERPYLGRLWVLVDDGVASSGETFTMLASQIPGAKRVGTNTLGCTKVGNVASHEPLPHTRIGTTFGRTAFHVHQRVPIAEGRGMFPHLWLDELDPVAFLGKLPR